MGRNHVFLIRHGETEWSKSGQHTGGTNLPLTEAGMEQGRLLTDRLKGIEFATVLTSPLQRAMETCRQADLLHRAEVLDELREWDYGAYEGLTTPEIWRQRADWSIWMHGAPQGESPEQVAERADRVLERARTADGDVALFSHGHMLRAVGARWLGLPVAAGQHLMLSTASVSVLGYERETPVIRLWNGRAHLSQFT
ncbi:MAG: histidine phosphatase family protein [Candidatus Nephthysia bennettiae]|uniref:Histidine phosphatase family protein n=1 Tax=Candidatus Nephthysia bennettiae TaxID=3127016 RepID=A0A934K1E3_9BACT|nr:histidine phosphatase family protein [Candidatus Dormibacteraeota bacterium]MBJ7614815.1 histidine phosphatase family protein [Candidatus Dormibacteraeota bacterium]PZR84951.1 MAG: histidine phosphatase family protein [Candidatus Dormibacteraeota bacterium]